MGYAVLHLDKAVGTDSAMSAHIERTIHPKNAHQERTHLNRELIDFPIGIENRTDAIQYRLNNAGLKRKIGKNQVQAIRVLLTGSADDMKEIEAEGKLDSWCDDNLQWLSDTYGADNIVSAVLHLDETTPHLHATLVPIVTGERRKAKKEEREQSGRKYRKKNSNASRLCADDVMSRVKLKKYQDTYAERMAKYGLKRGIEGSKAKHVNTASYYKRLVGESETLELKINELKESNPLIGENELLKKEITELKKSQSLIFEWFPILEHYLEISRLCEIYGLMRDQIAKLIKGVTIIFSGSLYSPDHDQRFNATNSEIKLVREDKKINLKVDYTNIGSWFQKQYKLESLLSVKTERNFEVKNKTRLKI